MYLSKNVKKENESFINYKTKKGSRVSHNFPLPFIFYPLYKSTTTL